MIAAILETKGNLLEMSGLLLRRRSALRDYIFATIEVKDVYDEVHEALLDSAESMHNTLALSGDGPALRFILSTLGKERGYTTRIEQTGKDGGPVQMGILDLDVTKLTTEELRALKKAMNGQQSSV